MNPTAAAVIAKKSSTSRFRTELREKNSLIAEAIADATHREEVLRGARIPLELLPQMPDVDVDGARVPVRGVAPDVLQEDLPCQDATRGARERGEDLELHVGQPDRLIPHRDETPLEVDRHLAARDRLLGRGPPLEHLRSAEHRLHPAAELP